MSDDQFDDEADNAADEEFDAHADAVRKLLDDYADEHDLSEAFMSDIAFDLAVRTRMLAYCFETAKPSGSGLKLELDRCGREVDETIRAYKKEADDFVRTVKELLDAAERDEGPGRA